MSKNPETSKPDQIEEVIGQVLPKDALFLSVRFGSAKDPDNGREFDLSTDMHHQPLITSKSTGKTWTVTWSELISLAIVAGVAEG